MSSANMAAMASTDIQIVNISNLEKIETFLNDSAYKELLENSENYNTRLCIERRLRMPFLDPQTGVAQNHCALFMKRRQRMPGLREGQIYSYPSGRWRKSRRQYLIHQHRPFRVFREPDPDSLQGFDRSSSAAVDTDSRDSHSHREEAPPKEWFYDEVNMHEIDPFEERDPDSDFDYDDNNYKKKRRGRKPNPDGVPRRGRGRGRGRRRGMLADDGTPRTPSKRGRPSAAHASALQQTPTSSLQSSALAGTSSNLPSSFNMLSSPSSSITSASATTSITMTTTATVTSSIITTDDEPPATVIQVAPQPIPESVIAAAQAAAAASASSASTSNLAGSGSGSCGSGGSQDDDDRTEMRKPSERGKAAPSPYCDFCLGDSRENKKTSIPEDLVSCSDCGRSGHPTCLQFTPNMIISVRRYRWQCIECKYCSICGTSDNDDQLLFCDDCDRGYHMYCLTPALTVPPEGSWSCNICHEEFHK